MYQTQTFLRYINNVMKKKIKKNSKQSIHTFDTHIILKYPVFQLKPIFNIYVCIYVTNISIYI